MNTKTVSDYWKKAVSITTGKEKKDRSGGYSLVFAGSVFSLLGCNYLYKSSFFDYNEYVSLREAITRMKNTPDNTEIPVTIQGKVLKVLDGDGKTAVRKSAVTLHTCHFNESSGNWKEQTITLKEELYGSNFILVTPSGECITVLLPEVFPSHHVHIPYLVKTPKRLMNKEDFCDEIARQHLSDEASIDMEVVKVEEELLVNHHVYLKGILKKENGMYTLSYGKGSKLIISSKEITSLNKQNRTNGIMFTLAGIGLLVGGWYRLTYYTV